jgi:hypothetical protein
VLFACALLPRDMNAAVDGSSKPALRPFGVKVAISSFHYALRTQASQ